jgi:hypothetical protein
MPLDPEDNRDYQLPPLRLGPANDGHVRPKPNLDQLDHSTGINTHYSSYLFDHEED